MVRPIALTLVAIFLSNFVFAQDAPKKEANPLRGKWKGVKLARGNGEGEPPPPGGITFDFDADGKTINVTIAGEVDKEKATYTSDTSKTPWQITLQPPRNQPAGRGIFKIEKDVLTICVAAKDGVEAPKSFDGEKHASVVTMTLERVK